MQLSEILNKSQRYAEIVLRENGFQTYLIRHKDELDARPGENYDQTRIGLLIRNGRVANLKVG